MSIRLRLLILYSSLLAITLLGFSLASYVTVARDGFGRLEDTLASKMQRIISDPTFQLNDIQALAHQFAGPEVYVQTRDATSAIVDRSPNLAENSLPLIQSDGQKLDPTKAWVNTAMIGEERRLIYSQPLYAQDELLGHLQISNSLTDRDRSLTSLARTLVIANILVILAAIGTGWRLAGIGLRPIHRLTDTASAIGQARDFSRRVNHAGPNDEIGQLSSTFNRMLTELERAHRKTEQALETQKRFVADASHELRTPLTTIRGNIELLRREPPISDMDRLDVLNDVADETDRLIRMVNDLLLLARADVHHTQLCEPVRLRPLLDASCRQIAQLAPDRQIEFTPPPDIIVMANEDALKQVLIILLDNAVKHTAPAASISVCITAENALAQIHVCDTGPGIPSNELPHIFDRFYVVDSARTHNSTGLGLAIANTLMKAQNGTLSVENNPERGVTFIVSLDIVSPATVTPELTTKKENSTL